MPCSGLPGLSREDPSAAGVETMKRQNLSTTMTEQSFPWKSLDLQEFETTDKACLHYHYQKAASMFLRV